VRRLIVVKLGGSFAFSPHLRDWLAGLATCAGRVVVVPGGGPFADAVREAQPRMGFDHGAAHHMALLAMSQYGCALASLADGFALVASSFAIEQAVLARRVPVWSPVPMALRSGDLPVSWEATADSVAAWLARRIRARRLLLVKQAAPVVDPVPVDDLVAGGVVDPMLPRIIGDAQIETGIAGAADHALAAAAIRNGTAVGVRIEFGRSPGRGRSGPQ
jgi:aspartokinase-like uncharacterized kinase